MKKNLIYFAITSLFFMAFEAQALKLYLLSNHDNAGDHNQTLGIRKAFEKLASEEYPTEDLNTKTTPALAIKETIQKELTQEKVIVIGAGEGGIDGIAELPKHPNLITCLTSHMPLDRYKNKEVLEKVDFIALPTHVASAVKNELGSKLIETTGVAHNRCLDMAIYEKWKADLPHADVYLGVYLGGDAPAPENEMKLFTQKDADSLAKYVIQKGKTVPRTCILVLNGPRTGKFDAEKKENTSVHRMGHADPITDFFAQRLAESGVKYKILDFQYDTKPPYNAVDLVAGAVSATNGTMIVPGESTSVISESIDTLPRGKVIVYHNSAMNEVHKDHVSSELKSGRVVVLEDYRDIKAPAAQEGGATPPAAQVIAQRLLQAAK